MSRKVATLLGIALIGVAGIFYYLRPPTQSRDPIIENQNPASCFAEEEYVAKLRSALQGSLGSFKELLYENDFSAGVMESDDNGPVAIEDFVGANKDVDLSKIQIEESHAYFKVNNWKDGHSLFLFPRRIENCVYLTGAYIGSPDLTLAQVESWQQQQ